jgi:hypothetical protein
MAARPARAAASDVVAHATAERVLAPCQDPSVGWKPQ